LRVGAVSKAVVSVLTAADQPMRVRDIHQAVATLLGQPVSASSIKARLSDKTHGERACFERTARGYCRLRHSD
jgi:hypothetical protein